MDLSTFETYLIACLPSLTAVIGLVAAGIKIIGNVKGIKTDVEAEAQKSRRELRQYRKENDALKSELNQLIVQNNELNAKLDKIINKMNGVL